MAQAAPDGKAESSNSNYGGGFPPAPIADPREAAALTPFAEEALAAIRDEPVTRLHEFDLGAWKDQGATEAFLARIRREGR